jgi:hypothetical protein
MDAVLSGRVQMREVKVKKLDLLERVRANRSKHVAEFQEACAGYKDQAVAKIDQVMGDLKERIARLREGETVALLSVHFGLNPPESHEKDYDQVITMLEMSVDDELSIRSDEFACYVMDEWDWTAAWRTTTANYGNSKK